MITSRFDWDIQLYTYVEGHRLVENSWETMEGIDCGVSTFFVLFVCGFAIAGIIGTGILEMKIYLTKRVQMTLVYGQLFGL